MGLRIYGDVCLVNNQKDLWHKEKFEKTTDTCKSFILTGFIVESIIRIILAGAQYYSLALIFLVARQNEHKVRDTACKQISYLFVFITNSILIILQCIEGFKIYTNAFPNVYIANDRLFFYIVLDAAIM